MDTQTVAPPGTVSLSTSLDINTPSIVSGGGAPSLSENGDNGDMGDFLASELANMRAEDEKAGKREVEKGDEPKEKDAKAPDSKDEKPAKEVEDKPAKARAEDGKFTKAEQPAPEKAAVGQGEPERRPSEGRQHQEPPARFLPEAREKWANVPREVKAEFHRVSQEYEGELTRYKEAGERYESLRRYDELARANGGDLSKSLEKISNLEQTLARSPLAGLEMILREAGPRKPDGSHLSLMEVAQFVVQQNPQALHQMINSAQPQQAPQKPANDEVAALRAELYQMRAEQTIVPVINQFIQAHPDAEALSPQIGKILETGVIKQIYGPGLSMEQELAEAYRMAGGRLSPSHPAPLDTSPNPGTPPTRPVNPDAGQKSVRGAPADGADTATAEPETDIDEFFRQQLRKVKAS